MIASLQGEIQNIGENYLVVNIGGFGVQVFVPNHIKDQRNTGEKIFLQTQLIVREDSLTLFGFENASERDFFNLFLGVNGVGPRMALAILSTLSIDAIRRAVLSEQSDLFSRVPGVGKKTAQKILLHLQDKVSGDMPLGQLTHLQDIDLEVQQALITLGYSIIESQTAIQSIPKDAPHDLEARIVLALKFFSD